MDTSDIGDRMKTYEAAFKTVLPIRMPIIIRLDGKAFHTYTRGLDRPYDMEFIDAMRFTAHTLCTKIQGAELAYVQSDEISVLVHYHKKFNSSPWFDNEIQKIVSISASIASTRFTEAAKSLPKLKDKPSALFDSRVFILPEVEVCNYFHWRQLDSSRNSIQMLARSMYSQKECYKKNCAMLQEMCYQKGTNWNNLSTINKRGFCIKRMRSMQNGEVVDSYFVIDNEIPIFSQNRNYIESHLFTEEG